MRYVLLCFMSVFLMASSPFDFTQDDVRKSIFELHKSKNGKFYIWNECGKRLDADEREVRATEYSEAIMASIQVVKDRTGVPIDPRHVRAILFRESSDNECVIGRQETDRLRKELGKEPGKKEMKRHVRRWFTVMGEVKRACRKSKELDCRRKYIWEHYPEYKHIPRWDIGAAQFRFPSSNLSNRPVILPDGTKIDDIKLDHLFDYRVSIQLLVEDLAKHKGRCGEDHKHFLVSRWGKKTRLSTEQSYYVHHHTGGYKWSEKYWKRIKRHLKVIDKVKSPALAHLLRRFYSNKKILL